MILQAHEYEQEEAAPGRLQEFFDSTNGRFHHPDVVEFVKCLQEERDSHVSSDGDSKPSVLSQKTTAKSEKSDNPPEH